MSELLERSIKALTNVINVTAGLSHPLDEARAKELLRALYSEGEELDFESVKYLAVQNNWPERHAEKFGKLAQQVGEGRRVVVKHPRNWGEPTVEKIKAELSEKKPNK